MKKFLIIACLAVAMASCIKDKEPADYTSWKEQNQKWLTETAALTNPDGTAVYTLMTPDWAPEAWTLMEWHNDRSLTTNKVKPMSNSVCNVKYDVEDINGKMLSSSYAMKTYGDSIYRCKPNDNIVGFWYALINMCPGDSVTCIIPPAAGYGNQQTGDILPWSTLVYHIKLVSIPAYEKPL